MSASFEPCLKSLVRERLLSNSRSARYGSVRSGQHWPSPVAHLGRARIIALPGHACNHDTAIAASSSKYVQLVVRMLSWRC